MLLNSSRGTVVVGRDLGEALSTGRCRAAVLDVWEHEPAIDTDLLKLVAIGTPHIAGYSFDGKVAGTRMLYDTLCREYGITDKQIDWASLAGGPDNPRFEFAPTGDDHADLLAIIRHIYNIEADDDRLRKISGIPADEQGAYFDRLRKEYPVRREAWNYTVSLSSPTPSLKDRLTAMRFNVA